MGEGSGHVDYSYTFKCFETSQGREMDEKMGGCLFVFNVGVISLVSARGLVCFLFHCLEGTVPV